MGDINYLIAQGFDPSPIVQPFIDAPKNALAMKMAQSQLDGNKSENALRKAQIGKISNEQEQQAKLQTFAKIAQISQKHAADVNRDPANLKMHNASAKMLADRFGVGQYWQDSTTPEQALQEDATIQQQYSMMLGGDVYGTTPLQTVKDGRTIASYPSKYAGIDPKVTTQDGVPASVESAGMRIQVGGDNKRPSVYANPDQFIDENNQKYYRTMDDSGRVSLQDISGRVVPPEVVQRLNLRPAGNYIKETDKVYGDIQKDNMQLAASGAKKQSGLKLARNLLENGMQSGFGAPFLMQASNVFGGEYAGEAKVFNKLINDAQISMQTELVGSVSNAEQVKVDSTFGQLGDTEEAAWKALRIADIAASRAQQMPQYYRKYVQSHPEDREGTGFAVWKEDVFNKEDVLTRINTEWRQVKRGIDFGKPAKIEPYKVGGGQQGQGGKDGDGSPIDVKASGLTPQQLKAKYPSGTRLLLPDGSMGQVP